MHLIYTSKYLIMFMIIFYYLFSFWMPYNLMITYFLWIPNRLKKNKVHVLLTTVWIMLTLSFLICHVQPYMSTTPSSFAISSMESIVIKVPVLPTPALKGKDKNKLYIHCVQHFAPSTLHCNMDPWPLHYIYLVRPSYYLSGYAFLYNLSTRRSYKTIS